MTQSNTKRIETVRNAMKEWRDELFGPSGRNYLYRYRDFKASTLDLTPNRACGVDVDALDSLLGAGKAIRLSQLFPGALDASDNNEPFADARRRLKNIHKRALVSLEEKGVQTLFLAIGLATWKVDSGAAPNAPVILVPIEVRATNAAGRDYYLEATGDAHLNPMLTNVLRSDFQVETNDDEADLATSPPISLDGYVRLLGALEASWATLPGLEKETRVVVTNFSYATLPLVSDLEQNAELFADSDIVAAIAGDKEARDALKSFVCDPDPNQPDFDSPSEEFLVLDADSSQHMAINQVLGGESLVIQGPPGTGKSQTIANLITALMARGKRILFVAEKRAAIEAVTKRLDFVGLSELVMDMHGGITSRRDFAQNLSQTLNQVSSIPAQNNSELHLRLRRSRDTLIAHDTALHEPRTPWQLSVYEIQTMLLEIPKVCRTVLRLSTEAARGLDKEGFSEIAREIDEWVSLEGHLFAQQYPEWDWTTITTSEESSKAFDLIQDISSKYLPEARDSLFEMLDKNRLVRPKSAAEWGEAVWFLKVASGSFWSRLKAQLTSSEYRRIGSALGFSGSLSLTQFELSRLLECMNDMNSKLAELIDVAGLRDLGERPYDALEAMLKRMASGRMAAVKLPRIRDLEAKFRRTGINDVTRLVGSVIQPDNAVKTFKHSWLRRILDDIEFQDLRIAAFDSDTHSIRSVEFSEADCQHRESTPLRIQRRAAEAIIATMNAHPDETLLVRKEAAKKRRHLSPRQLLAKAPHVLTTLRPCWTMSPILAAEVIPADLRLFDVVIFDEASQIPPAEAISSLVRAPQAVIAGDKEQLPPTSFFGSGSNASDDDHDDDMSMTRDMESLLDVGDVLLRDNMLQWHYRSRDDRLIAFSNNHIYGGALTAFPGTMNNAPVTHCLVSPQRIINTTHTNSHPDEVEKVAELVINHARTNPRATLGVIAFGQKHANNIEDALARSLGEMNDSALDNFFSDRNTERFFVKNIERVQGDERDNIILSVGYHKDVNGKLPYRFGPLLQEGGERRLNVAVTRARSNLTIVSSFSHHDMAPGRSSAKGVELLRKYLEYAASECKNLGSGISDVPLNPFELSVKRGLDSRGIPYTPQYGVCGYRIDFACAHPDEPGRMVLAVEADGASYHSIPTTRDRDRLRQQVLESKGWRFHRIWSTAWFRDRQAELDKVEEAWKRAVQASDKDELPETLAERTVAPPSNPLPQRGLRPGVPRKGTRGYNNITDYAHRQLVELARWISSDTLLRTDDDLIREMMEEIGFTRSGNRIRAALSRAIKDPASEPHAGARRRILT